MGKIKVVLVTRPYHEKSVMSVKLLVMLEVDGTTRLSTPTASGSRLIAATPHDSVKNVPMRQVITHLPDLRCPSRIAIWFCDRRKRRYAQGFIIAADRIRIGISPRPCDFAELRSLLLYKVLLPFGGNPDFVGNTKQELSRRSPLSLEEERHILSRQDFLNIAGNTHLPGGPC